MLAEPLLIQVLFSAASADGLNRRLGESDGVACPPATTGASNCFELVVAGVISLFRFQSGVALATVVGVRVELPAMRRVVHAVNRSQGWCDAGRDRR